MVLARIAPCSAKIIKENSRIVDVRSPERRPDVMPFAAALAPGFLFTP
jgi:hypothetical protein